MNDADRTTPLMKIFPKSPDGWYDVAFRMSTYCVLLAATFVAGIQLSAYFDYFWRNGLYWLLQDWAPISRVVAICAAGILLLWSYLRLREPRYFQNVRYATIGIALSAMTFAVCWFSGAPASMR